MILYPTIEIQQGRCVSLFRGRLEEPQIWHVDPLAKARSFAEAGAEWIHVTDFDAIQGDDRNQDLLEELILKAGAPIQLGGGFRSLPRIEEWIDRGAGRIVVGTLAILAPDMVKEAAKLYPDQIVLAVDVFKGKVMGDGWRNPSAFDPISFIQHFETDPLAAIQVTDIDADLEEAEDSLALISSIAGVAKAPVIASGLTRSLDDLARLKYEPHISGAIMGRALFDRSVEIADAMEMLQEAPEAVAEFI